MNPIEEHIARVLGEIADYPTSKITAGTRIYHDAGVAGDDLYDFAVRLYRELGIVLPFKLSVYAPGEGIGFGLRDFFPWWFKFKELTVSDLAVLVASERDAESAMGRFYALAPCQEPDVPPAGRRPHPSPSRKTEGS